MIKITRKRLLSMLISPLIMLTILSLALVFGGPSQPKAMDSINNPFKKVDFSDMPRVQHYQAQDGQKLAYRSYSPLAKPIGSVTLIHGSSASSNSMHPLAKALLGAGYQVYSLDTRGHGESGKKGHIDYIGQLESDLVEFAKQVRPVSPSTLVGFSAGAGFVLRVAGSPEQSNFGSYLLLSPFISQDAPNYRPLSGGWANVGIPRIIALSILNGMGIKSFNHLAVTSFALNDESRSFLTPEYDFNLAMNFRPQSDYANNIRQALRPVAAIVGDQDEAFYPSKLEPIFRESGQQWPVQIVPGIGHIPLTLEAIAHTAIVQQVSKLQNPVAK